MAAPSEVEARRSVAPQDEPRAARRPDRTPWLVAAASVVVSATFLLVSLYYNQGRLIPPLDDVYIHLQYGRQLGMGEFFRYNSGDPISTGASSLLYSFVLAAGWVAGFHGALFLGWAVLVGVVCAALTTSTTYLIGRELGGRRTGAWAALLVVTNGAFAWGATSGMEVTLVAALLMGTILAVLREAPAARFRLAPLLATLLALVRPEGLIMAVCLCAVMVLAVVRAGGPRWRLSLVLLPVLAGAAQLVFYRLATGSFQANGVQAKSWFRIAYPFPTEDADRVAGGFRAFLGALLGLGSWDLLAPGALVLAVLGAVGVAVARPAVRPLVVASGVGFVVVLVSLATLATALWQDGRYVQPFLPLLCLFVVAGVRVGVRLLVEERYRRPAGRTVLALALVFSLSMLPTWALRLGQQAATIREAPVSVANWLAGNVPPGQPIAVNDVGATAYFSGHPVVDVVGLTTEGLAEPSNQGVGSLYEALRAMPPDRRPAWFSIYNSWGGVPVGEFADAGLLGDDPVQVFTLTSPTHDFGGLPAPCQTDHGCPTVSIWRADWSRAGSGDRPDTPPPGTVRDYVNVGSLGDEARHGYEPEPAVVGAEPTTVLSRTPAGDPRRILDSGREIHGGERFTLRGLVPGQPVTLTGRVDPAEPGPEATIGSRETEVRVAGRDVGTWRFATDQTPWTQASFVIPADAVTGSELTVDLGPRQELLAPYPDYVSFGYWASQ